MRGWKWCGGLGYFCWSLHVIIVIVIIEMIQTDNDDHNYDDDGWLLLKEHITR